MPKLYISFHPNGVVRDIGPQGDFTLPGKSTLALRYALVDSKVVDQYAGKNDDEVLALIKAQQENEVAAAQAAMPKRIDKLEFLRRFTREERAALRTAQKTNVIAADLLTLIDLSDTLDLKDADLVANLIDLEAAGLLAAGRTAALLA